MAIVYLNGFGTLPASGDLISVGTPGSGTITYSRQAGRSGGYALRATNSTAGTTNTATRYALNVTGYTEFSVGFALNHRNNFSAIAGQTALRITVNTGAWDIVLATASSTTFGNPTSTTAWTVVDASNTAMGWHWWNWVYRQSATVGICELYRDGVLQARANGDTVPGAGPYIFDIGTGNANGGSQVDLADFVFRNDAVVIPDTAVASLFPDGTSAAGLLGSDGDSTNNHLLVNENPTYDAANYVGSATVGAVDTYTLANLPSTASSVAAVQVTTRAFKSDAGVKTMTTVINDVDGTAVDPGGGSTIHRVALTNPSGGAAWTTATVNSMTAGIKVVS